MFPQVGVQVGPEAKRQVAGMSRAAVASPLKGPPGKQSSLEEKTLFGTTEVGTGHPEQFTPSGEETPDLSSLQVIHLNSGHTSHIWRPGTDADRLGTCGGEPKRTQEVVKEGTLHQREVVAGGEGHLCPYSFAFVTNRS